MKSLTATPAPEMSGVSSPPSDQGNNKQSTRRLIYFVSGLLLVLGALECLVRRNASLFEGASHRALAKAAMFGEHPQAKHVFLGTSRTQDGVSPVLVARALKEIEPELGEFPGYNAAFTGSSLDALTSLAPRFFRPGLQIVIIEISQPQIANEPVPWDKPETSVVSLEDRLGEMGREIDFIQYRTAFRTENLGRLPALLLFSSSLSGWETKGKDQIASWLGREEKAATGFNPTLWSPLIWRSDAAQKTLNATNEIIATRLAALSKLFGDRGIKVAFAIPPLSQSFLANAPEKAAMQPLFSEVARRGNCEVWDFASLSLPDSFFRDPSHLGKEGRAHYSQALAVQMARVLPDK